MAAYPRFRFGEVVRVCQVPVYEDDDEDDDDDPPPTFGMEGVVSGIGPDHETPGWGYNVWLPELERVWGFDESDLESVGLVEVEKGEPDSRVPLDPETPPHEAFGGELVLKLITEIGDGEAAAIAENAMAELRELFPIARATWKEETRDDDPEWGRRIPIHVTPVGNSREAFEILVASRQGGWIRQVDDGWSCHFWWSRPMDADERTFLDARVGDVSVALLPWSDPTYRPVRRGRTHDPGLPGYTPPDPPAGYED